MIELTVFNKSDGPLTKRISLVNGKPKSGPACVMGRGTAHRVKLDGVQALADLIANSISSKQALALGSLKEGLGNTVLITTKSAGGDGITRTLDNFEYRGPAYCLLDFDSKGMPFELPDYWVALCQVLPELAGTARVERKSTSAGLFNKDTGEQFVGSGGVHIYIAVEDGTDIERFLKRLHERCWLAGFGWYMVGNAGDPLDRSIVDRMVFGPERLCFEGAPHCVAPLAQDLEMRQPVAYEGELFDTHLCRDLNAVEESQLEAIRAVASQKMEAACAERREQYIQEKVADGADRAAIEKQCKGVLYPSIVLEFADPDVKGTVGDVLANPGKYVGEPLADPNEGVEYGSQTAKIMRGDDGWPWINSFAHGHTTYQLRYDAAAVVALLDDKVDTFLRLVVRTDLNASELNALIKKAAMKAGVLPRELAKDVKLAQEEHAEKQRQLARKRWIADRRDLRPLIDAPLADAPWQGEMDTINSVLSASTEAEPPMRDCSGFVVVVRNQRIPKLHELGKDDKIPAPEQPLLARLTPGELGEFIERYIDYRAYDKMGNERAVHPPETFVNHYLRRDDEVLPTVMAVAMLPMVTASGDLIGGRGLNREHGIIFRVPDWLKPSKGDVVAAVKVLRDEWLCDVLTDDVGKAVIIADACTIIQRHQLAERPFFFYIAAMAKVGKTTTLHMLSMAVNGVRSGAASWSTSEEEVTKALLAYLMMGPDMLVWDNMPRGLMVSSDAINRSSTALTIQGRLLGQSKIETVPATTIQHFNGNNISPDGDMASRSLIVRLTTDLVDPMTRTFTHKDPIGWTAANRDRILGALYTILLAEHKAESTTRFTDWYELVGSKVEYAMKKAGYEVDFASMFIDAENEAEQGSSLADVLKTFHEWWPEGMEFTAKNAADNLTTDPDVRNALEHAGDKPATKPDEIITATKAAWKLKAVVDRPVQVGEATLTLRRKVVARGAGADTYHVELKGELPVDEPVPSPEEEAVVDLFRRRHGS